jgi:Kdo2-lipid IVA lauroyltransferase/acyltransferase
MLMRVLIALVGIWPERWALAFGEWLGRCAYSLGVRRQIALSNLALAFPGKSESERREICRAHFAHLGRSAIEFFLAARWSESEFLARVDPGSWDVLARAHAQGNGLIACVSHLGSFELFAAYGARRGLPLTVVTRQLRGVLNRAWLRLRGELGVRELRGRDITAKMLEVLRAKGVLAVVIDQNMRPKRAVFAPFFGKLAATTPAPAILAERTGAPIVLGALLRDRDGRFRVHFEGPFALRGSGSERTRALTETLNRAFEEMVRANPEQWFWVHRRWKTRPESELASEPVLAP